MLSYLKGTILYKGRDFVVLNVHNVGYKVMVHGEFYSQLELKGEAEIYTHQYVREDALDLYGFESYEKLDLFELLLSVSGIGPKSALNAVYIANVAEFKDSLARGDPSLLTKVSGIGKKTAERAVLDLKEKIADLGMGDAELSGARTEGGSAGNEEIEALMGLGYSKQQAQEALGGISPEVTDSGERIRHALKRLGG